MATNRCKSIGKFQGIEKVNQGGEGSWPKPWPRAPVAMATNPSANPPPFLFLVTDNYHFAVGSNEIPGRFKSN